MGVYSLEAAELLAAKNKPAINESFAPYENPILEYGIKSIRADFALFEAQLELDFKEYYDTLNEANNNNTNNQSGSAPFPGFNAADRQAEREQDKREKAEDAQDRANEKAVKDSQRRQALNKMKVDSGTLGNFKRFIVRIWENLIAALKSMWNRLLGSFNNFYDANGSKFQAAVQKLEHIDTSKYTGGSISIVNPNRVQDEFVKIIKDFNDNFKNDKKLSEIELTDVDNIVKKLNEDMNKINVMVHNSKENDENNSGHAEQSGKVSIPEAINIILNSKNDILNKTFTREAKKAYDDLTDTANKHKQNADNAARNNVIDNGTENNEKNKSIELDKEKAQKISRLASNIAAKYGSCIASAIGSVVRAASSIVANVEGRAIGPKLKASADALKNKKNKNDKTETRSLGDSENTIDSEGEFVNSSAFIDGEDDLLTESEAANILQFMVEDVCDINFNECFEF